MDPLKRGIVEVSPQDARLLPIFGRHLTLMRASSPACSVHAMEAGDLARADARMFAVLGADGAVIAMGALKAIDARHGEIKSMHVAEEARGRGLARAILRHILDEARVAGHERISLETGSQDVFEPARALYRSEGFESCGPFEGYGSDPNSAFLTRSLGPA